jgi:hypothetical protein
MLFYNTKSHELVSILSLHHLAFLGFGESTTYLLPRQLGLILGYYVGWSATHVPIPVHLLRGASLLIGFVLGMTT